VNSAALTARTAQDEAGVSLVELIVAMGLFLTVVTMVLMATGVMTKDTLAAQISGTDTDQATVAVNALADLVENAYWPLDALPWSSATGGDPFTSDCSASPSGGVYGAFPSDQGPVYSEAPTDLALCTFGASGSTTTHTDELRLVTAAGAPCTSGVCTLVVDQWPAPGQQGTATGVFSVPDVDASGTSLSYLTDAGGVWETATTPAATEAVTITIRVDNGDGQSATVTRTVTMANYGSVTP
jgi:hypothetical protein